MRSYGFRVLGLAVLALLAVPVSASAATFTHYGPPNARGMGTFRTFGLRRRGNAAERLSGADAMEPGCRRLLRGVQVRAAERTDDERAAHDAERLRSRDPHGLRPRAPPQLLPDAAPRAGRLVGLPGEGRHVGLLGKRQHDQQLLRQLVWRAPRLVERHGARHATVVKRLRAECEARHERLPYMRTYAGNLGWSFMCAMLQDTTNSQRLEYCFRVWRSWSGPAYDPPIVFFDPYIGAGGTGFTAIVSDVTASPTRYAQNWGGSTTVLGTQPSGTTYTAAITRGQLINAVNDTNAKVKSANLGTCIGLLNRIRCYSTDPDKYALLGVEDGLEFLGTRHVAHGRLLQRADVLRRLLRPRASYAAKDRPVRVRWGGEARGAWIPMMKAFQKWGIKGTTDLANRKPDEVGFHTVGYYHADRRCNTPTNANGDHAKALPKQNAPVPGPQPHRRASTASRRTCSSRTS